MEERENILKEIRQIAPALENISKKMPYLVPEGYFEMMPFQMLTKIAEPYPKPFVPEGYFDSLPEIILAKVKRQEVQEELESVAPLLTGINRQMPFSIPKGYFENLRPLHEIQEPAGIQEEAPVVPIQSKKRNPWIWAVAACVIALIGMFAWQNLWYAPNTVPGQQQVAGVTTDSSPVMDMAKELKELNDTSISSELKNVGGTDEMSSALFYLTTENIETALQHFSEEEIRMQLSVSEFPSKKDEHI